MRRKFILMLLLAICPIMLMAQERIYIQTDRNTYVPNDTIWFRAHLVDAATNLPSTSKHYPKNRSRYVYVELYDVKADTLVERTMIRRNDDGVFANAIPLKKTLHEGLYMLVAYTRYMLNFPETMFAYREIEIVCARGFNSQKKY